MTCAHCSVESGPTVGGEPTEAELLGWIRQAAEAGVRALRFTGGEPMLRAPTVLRLVRECRRLGLETAITTNGFWGRSPFQARRQLGALRRAGLGNLTVSYDRYHADFQGPDPILHISNAAEKLSVPLSVTVVRSTTGVDLTDIVNRAAASPGMALRVYDLQPVGRARDLPAESYRGEIEGFCSACSFPAITDDGRLIACNGPSYFERPESPLVLGSVRHTPLSELLDRHVRDPILDTIRTRGPAGLRDELRRIPAFENFPFRSRYSGICDLCHHVTRNPEAVAALRERLGRPEAVATRLAARQVIAGQRRHGTLSPGYVNGVGACRLFFRAASRPGAPFDHDATRILGNANLDWRRLADYLGGSGLSRPLLGVLDDPELTRWAPSFFRDALRRHGVSESLRELVQREAIGRTADALRELGGRGVLLKGMAFVLSAPADAVSRATTDVDILVEPDLAPHLRTHLLHRGFEGRPDAGPSTFHHLEPITYQGVAVEIHTRIMPGYWGLPEGEMLSDVTAIAGSDVLATLGPEALVLHAAVHTSASFFSFGLKTAWDLTTVLRMHPDVDWPRLISWAAAIRMPRGFWTPIRVLAEGLDLPLPSTFLQQAPTDRGARRIETIARHRIFRGTEDIFDLDVLTRTGLMLFLHEDWQSRARYLGATLRWRTSRPRTWATAAARALRADVLRQSWRQYQRYKRAMAAATAPVEPD